MGIAANQSRLMTITARMNDLELRAQQISAQKIQMSMKSEAIATTYANALNAGNGESAKATYDKEVAKLSTAEKALDLELTQINTEHTAVTTEYDSIKSLIKDNTDKSFSLFG